LYLGGCMDLSVIETEALASINRVRVACGVAELSEFLASYPKYGHLCAVAQALRGAGIGVNLHVSAKEITGLDRSMISTVAAVWGVQPHPQTLLGAIVGRTNLELPPEIATFIEAFDQGLFPHLEATMPRQREIIHSAPEYQLEIV
jgi:hypothetical protein